MSRPEPRPALKRSEDGSVHPAAPRVEPEQHLHPVPHAPSVATLVPAGDPVGATDTTSPDATASFTGKPVTLQVEIPKDLRKAVRRLADSQEKSVDAVVTDALADHVTAPRPERS